MNETISYIVLGISVVSALMPLFFGRKQYSTPLWIYILVGFSFDLLLILLKRILHIDHQWISHLYIPTELILISLYYRSYFFKSSNAFYTIILAGLLFYILTTLYGSEFSRYHVNGVGASGLLLLYIAYSILGFHKILKEQTIVRLENSSFFWANAAFLLNSSGSIIIFICIDYLVIEDKTLLYTLWIFKNILNVIKNIMLTRALTLKN